MRTTLFPSGTGRSCSPRPTTPILIRLVCIFTRFILVLFIRYVILLKGFLTKRVGTVAKVYT
ncbi:uncharacterized protein M6B38_132015 [Iris pallida]|uniref:Uncharacterized protein n=1 Tax=Iris pallida TaxID=29817 RepID=A0AAX6FQR3_IRIPA|nr:uncharacterized protein M6B38_132015 [Iris pallida]